MKTPAGLLKIQHFLVLMALAFGAQAVAGENPNAGPSGDSSHCQTQSSAGPGTGALLGAAAPLLVADFFLQDTLHEGSHCLAAELVGGNCTDVKLYPHMEGGTFVFGSTDWNNVNGTSAVTFALLAPKIIDVSMLGGYTALLETHSLPTNKWGRLALVVVATGAEIDLAKHFVWRNPDNDVERAYAINGIQGASRVPWEILYGSAILGGGIEVTRGWIDLFRDPPRSRQGPNANELTRYGSPVISGTTLGWRGEF